MEKAKFVKSGIYFLFLKGELQYIGKSVSVFGRIDQHRGEFDYDSVWFMPVYGDKHDLSTVESILIDIYQPSENTQGISLKRAALSQRQRIDEWCESFENESEAEITGGENNTAINVQFLFGKYQRPEYKSIESVAKYIALNQTRFSLAWDLQSVMAENDVRGGIKNVTEG